MRGSLEINSTHDDGHASQPGLPPPELQPKVWLWFEHWGDVSRFRPTDAVAG